MQRKLVILASLLMNAAGLAQPCQWQFQSAPGPEERTGSKLVFDVARSRAVLFGGSTAGSVRPDTTWEWDGASWSLSPATLADGRIWHAMTFDSARSKTILFGGATPAGNYSNETWVYNGASWMLAANTGPTPRNGVALCLRLVPQRRSSLRRVQWRPPQRHVGVERHIVGPAFTRHRVRTAAPPLRRLRL